MKRISQSIFRSAIYTSGWSIIYDDFLIKNNSSILNLSLNINNNCFVEKSIIHSIEGGQIKMNLSKIKINGGIIKDSSNAYSITTNLIPIGNGNIKNVSNYIKGGGLSIQNSNNYKINIIIFILMLY